MGGDAVGGVADSWTLLPAKLPGVDADYFTASP